MDESREIFYSDQICNIIRSMGAIENLRKLAENEEPVTDFSLVIEAIKELSGDKKFQQKLKKAEGISIRFVANGQNYDLLYDGKEIITDVDNPDATIKLNDRAMRMLLAEPLRDLYLNQDILMEGNLKKAVKLRPVLNYLLKEIRLKKQ